jgi:3'-phosphoadenosine 5'-phosphosulfate sulfotransferase (PAPS reductase)/FAD synthetase
MRPTEKNLCESGLPRQQMGRWCTSYFKTLASRFFYKFSDLSGINQMLGITRFQSSTREKRDPVVDLSVLSFAESKKFIASEDKTTPPEFTPISMDPEGNLIKQSAKYGYNDGKKKYGWTITTEKPTKLIVYSTEPVFDWTEAMLLDKMNKHNVIKSPAIAGLDLHGCYMCAFGSGKQYQKLRKEFPKLYEQAVKWRDVVRKEFNKDYSILHNPKYGTKEEQYKKNPENYYLIDPSKPATEDNIEVIM